MREGWRRCGKLKEPENRCAEYVALWSQCGRAAPKTGFPLAGKYH